MSILAALCTILAFTLFGLVADDHHHRFIGTRPSPHAKRRLRAGAWIALAAAFPPAIAASGWVFGPILWIGLTMLGAGIVFLTMNLMPKSRGDTGPRPR